MFGTGRPAVAVSCTAQTQSESRGLISASAITRLARNFRSSPEWEIHRLAPVSIRLQSRWRNLLTRSLSTGSAPTPDVRASRACAVDR